MGPPSFALRTKYGSGIADRYGRVSQNPRFEMARAVLLSADVPGVN